MKMVYERPMMSAEQFVTNAYCGPCISGTPITRVDMETSASGDWFSPNTSWLNKAEKELTAEDLKNFNLNHDFSAGAANAYTRPNNVSNPGETDYYWNCSCDSCTAEGGTKYYLEYSSEWAQDYPNDNVFVLHKETNGVAGVQIDYSTAGVFPAVNGSGDKYDTVVGAVRLGVRDVINIS